MCSSGGKKLCEYETDDKIDDIFRQLRLLWRIVTYKKNPMNRDIYQVVILKQSSQAQSLVWVGKKTVIIGHIYIIFSICHMIGNCEKILSFSNNEAWKTKTKKKSQKVL